MHVRKRTAAIVATAALTVATAGTAVATVAVRSGSQAAAAAAPVPVITVHMSNSAITLSSGSSIRAGRVTFKIVAANRGHALQIVRLHPGYTPQDAGKDFPKAFQGDTSAIHRI